MNTNEAVEKLIAAGKILLGQDLQAPLDKMFKELYSPLTNFPLKKKPFYNYQYQYCSSEAAVPADKEVGKVYWFIDKEGAVRYQVVTSNEPLQLQQGQLKEGITIPAPQFKYELKKVTTIENGVTRTKTIKQRTKCQYTIDDGVVKQERSIEIRGEDDDSTIKEKVRTDYLKRTIKQPLIGSLERKIGTALGKQKILPSNEADFFALIEPRYQEMVKMEKDVLRFVSELISVLEDESFKAIFNGNPKALALIAQLLDIAKKIEVDQATMVEILEQNVNHSAEAIAYIERAHAHCHQKNYQTMAALMASLDEITKKPEYLDKIKEFGNSRKKASDNTSVFFFLSDSGLATGFSAQLMLRRQMTFKVFVESFSINHPQIRTLEAIFNGIIEASSIINRAQCIEKSNLENETAMAELVRKSGMPRGSLGLNCLQLMVQVFVLLKKDRDPTLKAEDWDKAVEKTKKNIISCLERLKEIIAFSKAMGKTNLDPTSVSAVIGAIENPSVTPHEIILAITDLFNIISDNQTDLKLINPIQEISVDDCEDDSTSAPSKLENSNPNPVPKVPSALSSPFVFLPPTEKSDGKKREGNSNLLISELTGSKLFQTRAGQSQGF